MVDFENEKKPVETGADGSLDVESGQVTTEVLYDKNGFELFPQPVQDDELDPLNWSPFQKHGILSIVMALWVARDSSESVCSSRQVLIFD